MRDVQLLHAISQRARAQVENLRRAVGAFNISGSISMTGTHLGSWVVSDENAPGYGFHDVYTQGLAAKKFRETGILPDGTVLVKEIRKLRSGKLTTGEAAWATDNTVWFVLSRELTYHDDDYDFASAVGGAAVTCT